jgi:ribosome maturation factor RimP
MHRDIQPAILEILEPIAAAHGVEIVDAQVSGMPGRGLRLRVLIDTPENEGKVTVGECARFSREVGHGLDAAGRFPGKYMLEVSSPGVDRTLGRWVDFERVVGREISLETRQPLDGRRRFRGSLEAAAEQTVRIRLPEGASVEIPFAQVARAKALFSDTAKAKR